MREKIFEKVRKGNLARDLTGETAQQELPPFETQQEREVLKANPPDLPERRLINPLTVLVANIPLMVLDNRPLILWMSMGVIKR
ncbi:MAG: hypothetical protein JRJ85_08535 [Deltaproteobacteria bacterium]|nr:hypothetical protein [Deltaproteobacteria bacterium]